MNGLDKAKYWASICFVFAAGAFLSIAYGHIQWHSGQALGGIWGELRNLTISLHGPGEVWKAVSGGGFFAGAYRWVFEKWIWKIRLLQGWMVKSPNLAGTWVGVYVPLTKAMQLSTGLQDKAAKTVPSTESKVPQWAREKGVLPVQITIRQLVDKVNLTAIHPDSENISLAAKLNRGSANETTLYVVYANRPNTVLTPHATPHNGCLLLSLENHKDTKTATSEWRLSGEYFTNKIRASQDRLDRGTWGEVRLHWEQRELTGRETEFAQSRFDL